MTSLAPVALELLRGGKTVKEQSDMILEPLQVIITLAVLGYCPIGTKISILRKLETGKMVPDQALAKKLERFLKIILLHTPSETLTIEKDLVKKASTLTLGDVVIIQKRGVEEERERS